MANYEMTLSKTYMGCYDLRYYLALEKNGDTIYESRGSDWRYMVREMRRQLGLQGKHIETYNFIK